MNTKDFICKQFRIYQENTALKIGTDAFIIGSYTNHLTNKTILDIGTGTGILALMLAQKYPHAKIDAIEIDEHACRDATYNFSRSKWNKNLTCIHNNIAFYSQNCKTQYDIIISNPPFFHNSLLSPNSSVSIAKHSVHLTPSILIECVSKILSKEGVFSVIIPYSDKNTYIELGQNNKLHVIQELKISSFKESLPHRVILIYSRQNNNCIKQQLYIRNEHKEYSTEYSNLMKDYLLKF